MQTLPDSRGNFRSRPSLDVSQKLSRVAEAVSHREDHLAFLHEQPSAYRLLKQCVHPICVCSKLALIKSAERAAGADNWGIRKRRLEVKKETTGNQALMDLLQGVHDALKRQSSKRVREKCDVKAGRWLVQFENAANLESDTRSRFHSQHFPGFGDRVRARIDREDRLCRVPIAESQPAVTATDLENARAVETAEPPKSFYLSLWINHVDLESQLKEPRLTGGRSQFPCGSITVKIPSGSSSRRFSIRAAM